MNTSVYKTMSDKEIFPALWCTEPIAIAYAVSKAMEYVRSKITNISVTLDPGTHKNAIGVMIPNSWNKKGVATAAALGIFGKSDRHMEVLNDISDKEISKAHEITESNLIQVNTNEEKNDLYIDIELQSEIDTVRVIIEKTHTNIVSIIMNGVSIFDQETEISSMDTASVDYQSILRNSSLEDLIWMAQQIDEADIQKIQEGIKMQLEIVKALKEELPDEYQKLQQAFSGALYSNTISDILSQCTAATYARMSGINKPVMSSGGSGNQGIVAMLLPYLYGTKVLGMNENDRRLFESIALSNLINSYAKCFTWAVSSMCGCSIAAGEWAVAAIIYQNNMESRIDDGMNNMIASSGGMICDGAKIWCYNKVAASVVNVINAASQAMNSLWAKNTDGIVWTTGLESIQNISKIANDEWTNRVMIPIILSK